MTLAPVTGSGEPRRAQQTRVITLISPEGGGPDITENSSETVSLTMDGAGGI